MRIRHLPFDFVLLDKKIIIELDGIQHFKQVLNWTTPEEQQLTDFYKMKCANKNGFSIIRLLQDDVLKDKFDWLTELKQHINTINDVSNIFICRNNEYSTYKSFTEGKAPI